MNQTSLPDSPWVLYLHGFQSSPLSEKAVLTQSYLTHHATGCSLVVPKLCNTPIDVARQLTQLIDTQKQKCLGIIGSSLGGFYADWLGHITGIPRVLVNPVVSPVSLLSEYLGEHQNPYTKERFTLSQKEMDDFSLLEKERLSLMRQSVNLKRHILLLVEEGDETLDYSKAASFFKEASCIVEPNGNHRFENYEKWLPYLLKFLNLP